MSIGLNRSILDKFYTKTEIVKLCIDYFDNYIKLNGDDIIIEPSAGCGNFTNEILNRYKNKCISYDIKPESDKIINQDYLSLDVSMFNNKNICIIGNPPFGRQSSLAKKFIKKSCEISSIIAFILPKSFKKDSMQKCFDLYFNLVTCIDLPKNSFIIDDKEYDVPCVFQIWKKCLTTREILSAEIPKYYNFVKISENPDFSFRRVGVYAGKLDDNYKDKSIQSHYFIKLNNNIDKDEFKKKFNSIKFNTDNTVEPKSISKMELIHILNEMVR